MRIAVVIPSFNRASLLPRALDSVIRQTYPAHEIIVVDDGSTDATAELLAERYPDVRCHRQANRGVSASRNTGVRLARAEWIAFLDSDDQWHQAKLAAQVAALRAAADYRICHTNEIWVRRGARVNPMNKHAKDGGWIYQRCLPLCVISPSTVVISRALLQQAGGFDESLPACEDYDLWLRLCARHAVLYLPRQLVTKYGGHTDQLSRRYWGMDRFRAQALEKILDRGVLSPTDEIATLRMLVAKLTILTDGGRKHGNHQLLAALQPRLEHYRQRLARAEDAVA